MVVDLVVIGVDVGGTKVKAGAVEAGPDGTGAYVLVSQEIPTPRALPTVFYDQIAELVRGVRRAAKARASRVLPLIAVAHPGRFLSNGVLARGTTPNLGTAPDQFDGTRPAEELERRLSATVVAENDAVAQMRFGLDVLLRDAAVRPSVLGETVVYLGPGTGMGGGVARVSPQGEVAIVTDGHLFDLQVPGYGDGTLTAEELFTGPAITRELTRANSHLPEPIQLATSEQIDRLLRMPDAPAAQRVEAERIADACGEILALLIQAIHRGAITKVRLERAPDGRLVRHVDEPDRAWSAADRAAIRGARRFLLGGSVGCSAGLGRRIREHALKIVRERGPADVLIFQLPLAPADAGILGVVKGLPKDVLRNLMRATGSATSATVGG